MKTNVRKTRLWAIPFLTLLFFVSGQLLAVVPVVELGLIARDKFEEYPNLIYMLFGPFFMIGLITVLWVKLFERRSLGSIAVTFSRKSTGFYLTGFLASLLVVSLSVGTSFILGGYQLGRLPPFGLLDALPPLFMLIGFMLQAATEEIIFRGWILHRFAESQGEIAGITASSVGFTFLHLLAFDYGTNTAANLILFVTMTTLFSVYLSIKTLQTGSVWFACAWHAGWNWFFINGYGLPTTGINVEGRPLIVNLDNIASAPSWLNGGLEGPENTVITVSLLGVLSVVGWIQLDRKAARISQAPPGCY